MWAYQHIPTPTNTPYHPRTIHTPLRYWDDPDHNSTGILAWLVLSKSHLSDIPYKSSLSPLSKGNIRKHEDFD